MNISFSGKKALVTGAGQGIGKAIVLALVENGAQVVALDCNSDLLQSLKTENTAIEIVHCDVTAPVQVIRDALAKLQPFDCLVNSAGICVTKSFLDHTPEDIDKVMAVNFKGPMVVSQVVAQEMIAHQIKGSIVHLSSLVSVRPVLGQTVYCASKAALDMLARMMAMELGEHCIRVNCVNPTVVKTEMGMLTINDPVRSKRLLDRMPIKHFAEVEDVVNAVLFLLSDSSSMTTGAAFPVDGGYIAM